VWLFFIAGLSFIILSYAYLSSLRRNQQLQAQLTSTESELKNKSKSEKTVQQAYQALQNKLQNAIEDPVTHLSGWEIFEDRIRQTIQECARYQLTMAVLIVDVNDFKVINNALGQEMGNAVLLAVAQCLQAGIRKVDSVSRYKDDIFVVLLPKINKPEAAAIVAQRLLQTLSEPMEVKGQPVYVTANIGIAIYPIDGENVSMLLQHADQALQIAKQKTHQSYQFYHLQTHLNSEREYLLSMGLKRESLLDELEVQYQPIMDVKNKLVFCVEAKLYWHHPALGLIHTDELQNHLAKQANENKVAEWLLKKACQQFLHWRTLGFQPPLLAVSFSIKQLQNSQFIYHITQVLKEFEFKTDWLLLEVSGQSSQEFEMLDKTFNMLRYLNVKIALRDFGASAFSIQNLKMLSGNYVKLHPSMIEGIEHDQQTQAFLEALIVLTQSLTIQLIVQNVESEKQMLILNTLGCRFMQGHFVSVPLPAQQVTT
jgi:diguanylate cyclase (GGDEF)-like protein